MVFVRYLHAASVASPGSWQNPITGLRLTEEFFLHVFPRHHQSVYILEIVRWDVGMFCARPPASFGQNCFGRIIFFASTENAAENKFVKWKSHHLQWWWLSGNQQRQLVYLSCSQCLLEGIVGTNPWKQWCPAEALWHWSHQKPVRPCVFGYQVNLQEDHEKDHLLHFKEKDSSIFLDGSWRMNTAFLIYLFQLGEKKGILLLITSGQATVTFLPESVVFVVQCLSPGVGGTACVHALLIRQCKYEKDEEREQLQCGRHKLISHKQCCHLSFLAEICLNSTAKSTHPQRICHQYRTRYYYPNYVDAML